MRAPRTKTRAGFTLLESVIAVGLVTILLVNGTVLISTTQKAGVSTEEQFDLQHLASTVLDRIVLALMEADKVATLPQNVAPQHSSLVNYQSSLGVKQGVVIYSDPSRIWLDQNNSKVVWTSNPGDASEQNVVWGQYVRDFLMAEVGANLSDDNGNGLIDEAGVSFNIEADSVLVRITLERQSSDGKTLTATAETRATFRN